MNAPLPLLSPREIARLLDGDASGNTVNVPGPGHSRRDRSISITISPGAPDGLLVHDHAGDGSRAADLAAKDYVLKRLGLKRSPANGFSDRIEISRRREDCLAGETDDTERTARALALWTESRPPEGTPIQTYLEGRGVRLPDRAEEAIRYHAFCPFAGKRTPAMVALVRDIITDAPKAVHRTALSLNGHKVRIDGKDRLALGPIAGCAVKFTPDEDVTLALGVGEGIESTLSLRQLPEFADSPVWALLSAGGLAAFPVLGGIEALWIGVDRDPAGERAAQACADRWRAAGREVFMVRPKAERADLNDVAVKRGRRHAAR